MSRQVPGARVGRCVLAFCTSLREEANGDGRRPAAGRGNVARPAVRQMSRGCFFALRVGQCIVKALRIIKVVDVSNYRTVSTADKSPYRISGLRTRLELLNRARNCARGMRTNALSTPIWTDAQCSFDTSQDHLSHSAPSRCSEAQCSWKLQKRWTVAVRSSWEAGKHVFVGRQNLATRDTAHVVCGRV